MEIDLNKVDNIVFDGKIEWKYFFGGSSDNTFDRYYCAEINGVRVEKHASNRGAKFSIGNIDKAKVKYKTEDELLKNLKPDGTGDQNMA